MRHAEGVHLLLLGDSGVLFDEPAQKLFHLNICATFIWCQLESGLDEQTIELELQTILAISQPEAEAYLRASYTLFKTIGVVKGFEKIPEKPPHIAATGDVWVSYDDTAFIAQRRYHLLSSPFCVRFTTSAQLALVDPVLSHLQNALPLASSTCFDIIKSENGRIHICQDNLTILSCDGDDQLAPLVKSLLWQAAINQHDYFLNIHAGVVSDGERCYLFPAGSGSGKSTIIAALLQNGFAYFSDEAALIHEPDFYVESVPLAICVKSSGVDALSEYYPQLCALSEHHRSDGKKVRYLPPPVKSSDSINMHQAVAAIIFPRYCQTDTTTLEKIPSSDAFQALMQECLIVDKPLNKDNVSRLLTWVENTPSYSLRFHKLEEALALVKELSGRDSPTL